MEAKFIFVADLAWVWRGWMDSSLGLSCAWPGPGGGGGEVGSDRGGAEFTLTRAPRGLGSSTIGPGVASMGTIHPGSKGRRALLQDEKYKLSLCPVASGYWGIGAIGYRANGPNPDLDPCWALGRVDRPTFVRSVCSAPRAPGARVLGMYHPPARLPCAQSGSAGSLLLYSFCSRLHCSVLSALLALLGSLCSALGS